MPKKIKKLGTYLASLPEKKLTIQLQAPDAAVKDYPEDPLLPEELVAIGVRLNGERYVDGFEMVNPDQKKKLLEVMAGTAVTVTLYADDEDADFFPSVEVK